MKLLIAAMAASLVLSFNTWALSMPVYAQLETDTIVSENVEPVVENRTKIYVGDSRTVGMYWAVTGNGSGSDIETTDADGNVWIASVGQSYGWFESKAIGLLEKYIGGTVDIVCLMGVNDCYDAGRANNYVKLLNSKIDDWSKQGARVYFVSVNPLDHSSNGFTNDKIDEFNAILKSQLDERIIYVDTNQQIKDDAEYRDFVHYLPDTYRSIYDKINDAIKDEQNESDSDEQFVQRRIGILRFVFDMQKLQIAYLSIQ